MTDYCEHRFRTANEHIDMVMASGNLFINNVKDWNSFFVIETNRPGFFIKLFNEVRGFGFCFDAKGNKIFARGIKKDILDFMDLVREEHPECKIEYNEAEPITVFDPNCKECNASLDIGRVISIEI